MMQCATCLWLHIDVTKPYLALQVAACINRAPCLPLPHSLPHFSDSAAEGMLPYEPIQRRAHHLWPCG